jgi:hypothetical protein
MINAIEQLLSSRRTAILDGDMVKANEIEQELSRFNVSIRDTKEGVYYFIGV